MSLTVSTWSLLGAIIVCGCYLAYRALLPKPIPGIPYNKEATNSVFGDIPVAMKWYTEKLQLYTWLEAQLKQHNTEVIQLFMRPFGAKPWVVIADFQEAQDIMVRRTPRDFDRSEYMGDMFSQIMPANQVIMPSNHEWSAHRRLMGDTMAPKFLNEVVSRQVYSATLGLIELWTEKSRLARGHPCAVQPDVHHAAFDTIFAATFGTNPGALQSQKEWLSKLHQDQVASVDDIDKEVVLPTAPAPEAYNALTTLVESVKIAQYSLLPRPHHWFALHFYPWLNAARKYKDRLIQTRLDESWQRLSQNPKGERLKCAMDLVVQREIAMAEKDGRPPQYDTAAIQDELYGFLFGGQDTVTITTCWGLKYITDKRDVQTNLRAELRAHHQQAFSENRMPSVEEIVQTEVPYLDATIEEILRLANTPGCNFRRTTHDTPVLGHIVPKGTDVFMLNHGPSYTAPPMAIEQSKRGQSNVDTKERFGKWDISDIAVFKPERWLVSNGDKQIFDAQAGPVHTFGAGSRGCFGKRFAMLELKILFTLLVWSFDFKPTPLALSSFSAHDAMTHNPQQCFVRLGKAV